MRALGVYSSSGGRGGVQTRLRNQMKRLFNAHVRLVYKDEHGEQFISSAIADRGAFWWNERKPDQPSLWESKIELGEKFFNEIISHPVPLNMNTLKALKRSTLGLDLYLWLVYRTFSLRAPQRLTWRQVYRQFGSDPDKASYNQTVQNFRYKVLRELKKIKLAWSELNYSTARGVLILHPSTPAIAPSSGPAAPRRIAPKVSATEKSGMKSKISIWDCRRAIDIKGGLPLTMRGDLFDVDRPSAASVARWPPGEAARHTTRSQTGSMDRRKYSFYTLRAGIPHQAGARHHCGQRPLICLATIGPRRRGLGSQTTLTNPFPGLSAASQRPFRVGVDFWKSPKLLNHHKP